MKTGILCYYQYHGITEKVQCVCTTISYATHYREHV